MGPTSSRAAAVIPAAGGSRRMGRPKWRLPFGHTCVLGAVVEALQGGGADAIVLTLRPEDTELQRWAQSHGLAIARNPEPERGMLSSVQVGLDALALARGTTEPSRGWTLLVCPGDLPALTAGTVRKLLEALRKGPWRLAVPSWKGRRGHPLAIAPERVPEIATLDPGVGLRELLARHPDELLELPVDDAGCVLDVDTPADYERLTRRT